MKLLFYRNVRAEIAVFLNHERPNEFSEYIGWKGWKVSGLGLHHEPLSILSLEVAEVAEVLFWLSPPVDRYIEFSGT